LENLNLASKTKEELREILNKGLHHYEVS